MIPKINLITEKKYTKTPHIIQKQPKTPAFKGALFTKKILPATAGTILLSTLSVGVLLVKRILDNTNPPRK